MGGVENCTIRLNSVPLSLSLGLTELGNNKLLDALGLPVFTVYNMRSIWPKLNSLAEDIVERSADISFLSEV